MSDSLHPTHNTRLSDASTFDEICKSCGATDITNGGWGDLAKPCTATYQRRVHTWLHECFPPEVATDITERGDRLLEEVLELLQANGYPVERVDILRDYVFSRPVGEKFQEVGGTMVTLACYCSAIEVDMDAAGEVELARVNTPEVIEKIRRKQATKPHASPLPGIAGDVSELA